jgi:phenylacetate-CoA ligase
MVPRTSNDPATATDLGVERLGAAQLRSRVERPRLKRQLAYILAHSPFYRRKFKAFGQDADTLLRRFSELPFSDKREILADQVEFPPYGSNLCVEPRQLRRIHKTSGTTARPLLIAMTVADIESTVTSGARSFRAAGLGPGDTVVHCLNYCMWMGGYTDHQSLETAGATVVPYGVGHTKGLLDIIRDVRINAIHCTPSYLAILEEVLKRELGMQPRDLGLRLGLFGGEAGLETPDFRKNIETVWGMKAMNANYGMADVLSIFGGECSMRDGLHFMGQGNVLAELIEPQSLETLSIEAGVEGELVLTNLRREAQPMVRYRTGDIVRIVSNGRCDCGRGSFRFLVVGRSDDMLVVRGVNVFPTAVRVVLMKFLDELTGQYQIVIETPPPLQTILVRIEYRGTGKVALHDRLRERLLENFRSQMSISPKIEFVPEGTLPRTEGKTKLSVKSYKNP